MAAILEEKTEGWVTGLRLAAMSLSHRKDLKGLATGLPVENRYVMDYVVTEILSHQCLPSRISLKTSILIRFCAYLCDAVCCADKESDAHAINGREFLELLEKTNIFIIPSTMT